LIRWHEHEATEIQQVFDKVIDQAIADLEEAGYERSIKQRMKIIGLAKQRETTFVSSRRTGKPLSRAIVSDGSQTLDSLHITNTFSTHREWRVNGQVRSGADSVEEREREVDAERSNTTTNLCVHYDELRLYITAIASRYIVQSRSA